MKKCLPDFIECLNEEEIRKICCRVSARGDVELSGLCQLLFPDYLEPKIAEPTRTRVAPSAIAASKSPDIPMESSCMATPGNRQRCYLLGKMAQFAEIGPCRLRVIEKGGHGHQPADTRCGSRAICLTSSRAACVVVPLLVASPETFTCTRMSQRLPICPHCLLISSASDSRSTE